MGLEALLISLAAGGLTTLLRLLREDERLKSFWERLRRNQMLAAVLEIIGVELPPPSESYQERLNKLFTQFGEVMSESDAIVSELERHVRNKETVVRRLEQREQELVSQINKLRESPESVGIRNRELLEELVQLQEELHKSQEKEGKRSIWRDFILFVLGVLLPFLIGWLAPKVGIALPVTP